MDFRIRAITLLQTDGVKNWKIMQTRLCDLSNNRLIPVVHVDLNNHVTCFDNLGNFRVRVEQTAYLPVGSKFQDDPFLPRLGLL